MSPLTPTVLALAMLSQPQARVGRSQLTELARACLEASERYDLEPTLLAAVVLVESGGRQIVAFNRGKEGQGADVGAFQIHCPRATIGCILKHLQPRAAALRAGKILALGRELCERPSGAPGWCSRGWWARYNPGSKGWAIKLRGCLRAIKLWLHAYQQELEPTS